MVFHWVPEPVLNGQYWYFGEVIFWQLHLPVEDRHQMFPFDLLRLRVRSVALQAKWIRVRRSQQVQVVVTVRVVTDRARLVEYRLVQVRFLPHVGDFAMATKAHIDRVRLRQSRLRTGVRIVAIGAVTQRAGMLNFRRLNVLRLVVVAGDAKRLCIFLYEDYFPVLRRRVAGFAIVPLEWRMLELRHQLGGG